MAYIIGFVAAALGVGACLLNLPEIRKGVNLGRVIPWIGSVSILLCFSVAAVIHAWNIALLEAEGIALAEVRRREYEAWGTRFDRIATDLRELRGIPSMLETEKEDTVVKELLASLTELVKEPPQGMRPDEVLNVEELRSRGRQ